MHPLISHLSICAAAFVFLSLTLFGESLSEDEQALLANRAQLTGLMTAAESVAYARAESMLREGERDIQSGNFLNQSEATLMNPNRNVAEDRRRAEALISDGKAKVTEGQNRILSILKAVQERNESEVRALTRERRLEIPEVALEAFLDAQLGALAERIQSAGIDQIYFNTAVVHHGGEAFAHMGLRDRLHEAFKLHNEEHLDVQSIARVELDLDYSDNGIHPRLHIDGRTGENAALLAIELFDRGTQAPILSIRAFGIDSWTTLAESIAVLSDVTVPSGAEAELMTTAMDTGDELPRTETSSAEDPNALIFKPEGNTLVRFESLPTPYLFAIRPRSVEGSSHLEAALRNRLLQHLFVRETDLRMSETSFIRQNYPVRGTSGEISWNGLHNALLILDVETGESERDFRLSARARGSSTEVPLGAFILQFP